MFQSISAYSLVFLHLTQKKVNAGFFLKSFQSMIKVCNKIIYIYIKAEALIT